MLKKLALIVLFVVATSATSHAVTTTIYGGGHLYGGWGSTNYYPVYRRSYRSYRSYYIRGNRRPRFFRGF
ncbi:MAG: hypothetical protein ACR2NM_11875 [Bythopirellula sp.]